MKRKSNSCRVLSAILILFGWTFSWAAGACAISQYECIDLSTYDNSHPIEGSIKKSTPRLSSGKERGFDDAEIPNSGIIPSNIHGDYLGYISYGGTGTDIHRGKENEAEPLPFYKDFAEHDESGFGRWYGENGKKQFINFNDNHPKNLSDNTKSIRERLGGHGYYVFGDLVTAGGPIINPMPGDTFGESGSWQGGYINDGGVGTFNGSVDKIRLPKGVTKDDIVFARVYWFGHLYKYNDSGMGDSLREICSAEEKQKAGGLACKRFSPTLNIPDIKNYQNVKLKIGDTSYDIEREICEGEFAYNSAKGNTRGMNQKYNMKYVCSTDITDKVREKFKDFDESIDIGVGDIKATKEAATHSNIVWTRGAASADKNIDSGYDSSNKANPRLLPFGGWYVVLVYDKTLRSQAELKGLDFPDNVPDNVKYAKAISAGISGNKEAVNKHINSVFKPKNITLYDGYMPLEPTASRPDLTAEAQREITGFFTPKSGKVQGKLIFASFGANKGNVKGADIMSTDGIFVAKTMAEVNNNRLPNNEYNPANRSFFNGSRSWLEIDDDGEYELEGKSGYHQGFDLDEFDISDKLGNGQSQLAMAIKSSPYRDSTNHWVSNRAFVPFFGVSIDIYVPKLCYEQKMYDTQGWRGFYNLDGSPISGHAQVEDVHVVTGENLYYRTEIRNQEKDGEDANKVWVKVNTGRSNTYVENSSGIDNRLELTGIDGINDAKFVYLEDDEKGAYSTQAKRAAGGNPDVTDEIYNGKQLNSTLDNELKFYIGKDAGKIGSTGKPIGGDLNKGQSAYIEFNATVGRTFTYTPIRYTVGYAMDLAGKVIQGPTSIMERCETEEKSVKITLLNGLKVVNKNFKDFGDSDSDINKTKSQDDRLYTQISELPFDVNMIFKPDINDVFGQYFVERDSNGYCYYESDKIDLCSNYATIFVKEGERCRARQCEKLSTGAWGIVYHKKGELDGTLQTFPLPGKLYLSAIRPGSGCKYIDNRSKLPFKINGERIKTDYDTGFMDYQDPDHDGKDVKKVMPIEKVEFEDAFSGVTFMFSYYPRGLNSSGNDTNTTLFVGDLNRTKAEEYNINTDEWRVIEYNQDNPKEYYIWLQTQRLYEKYISGYKMYLGRDAKKELLVNWFTNPDNTKAINKFNKELLDIENEFSTAESFFGTEMSPDGSFHVCDSDSFVVRPAYFRADMDSVSKYAKLIDPNAKGDITKAVTIRHNGDYRVGGKYADNTDILGSIIYAESIKENPVPNYSPILGGNLEGSRFSIRTSYNTNSVSFKDDENLTTLWREKKTYLKPFISDLCYTNIQNQAFFTETDLNKRTNILRQTLNTCANTRMQYEGFKFENGKYILDKEVKVSKEENATENRPELGKAVIDNNCIIDGQVFATTYTKVWDKDANNLFADFRVKNIEIKEGYAEVERFSQNELMAQGILEPKDKKRVPASLYTEILMKNGIEKGPIFNYYNVGDVLVSVYDNSWTDRHGDQTFDGRKGPDGNYWGSTCIINSTSNIPDELGKVGCDVGMKDNQELVLRFRPDRVNLAIEGLATDRSNINPIADPTGSMDFVYYNSPDIPNAIRRVNGIINKSMIDDFTNLGRIRFLGEAYLSNAIYHDTIATLYDGTIIQGEYNNETYEVATCGFASDMNVTISFGFDCNTNPADQRCATDAQIQQTQKDTYYSPYVGQSDINYTIPAGTNFMTNCNNNNGISDSRCFRYNVKGGRLNAVGGIDTNSLTEADSSRSNEDFQVPLPIQFAVNYYTDTNKASAFISDMNVALNIHDPKNPLFILLARSFQEGTTQNATIYLNFDRMQKSPHLPLYVFATDFDITALRLNNPRIEPAKFNLNSVLVNISGDDLIGKDGKFTGKPYNNNDDKYESFIANDINKTYNGFKEHAKSRGNGTTPITEYLTRTGNVPAILFAYGKANEVNNGELREGVGANLATYSKNIIDSPTTINILDALFCDKANGCALTPNIVLDGEDLTPIVPNIFAALRANNAPNNNGFITNILGQTLGSGTNPKIKDIWVEGYYPDANTISIPRNNPNLTRGVEPIVIQAENPNGTNGAVMVEVLTRPWLIYTPHIQNVYVDNTKNMGNPIQYWNYFTISLFNNRGQWLGEGEVKNAEEVGDIGSYITGKDFQDIAKSDKDPNEQAPTQRSDRIDW